MKLINLLLLKTIKLKIKTSFFINISSVSKTLKSLETLKTLETPKTLETLKLKNASEKSFLKVGSWEVLSSQDKNVPK